MPHDIKVILVASFGALAQEFLHLYDLRANLRTGGDKRKFKSMLRSVEYWALAIGNVLIGGVFTWIWYSGEQPTKLRDYLIMGIAFPLIIKKVFKSFGGDGSAKLGGDDTQTFTLGDYFK